MLIETVFLAHKLRKIMLRELCKGKIKGKIKKVEKLREKIVRESKVDAKKCIDFY